MTVVRPADASETGWAWIAALQNTRGPTAILLTRQNLPVLGPHEVRRGRKPPQGGYVLIEDPSAKLTLLATGSEVSLALAAAEKLKVDGIPARVVNLPSWELFEKAAGGVPRAGAREAPARGDRGGVKTGWERYLGAYGLFLGMDRSARARPTRRWPGSSGSPPTPSSRRSRPG